LSFRNINRRAKMSTRAAYSFKDQNDEFHIYGHCDGYPSGAVDMIQAAIAKGWSWPRFEAGEFAAAFVAANKTGEGEIRIIRHYAHIGDLDYRYEISQKRGAAGPYLHVAAFAKRHVETNDDGWVRIWKGPFANIEELRGMEKTYG
jgi:hypothetical protein